MKVRKALMLVGAAAWLSLGCDATSRHRILTTLFDGVPPLKTSGTEEANLDGAQAGPIPARLPLFQEHGPYAAKLCNACHEVGVSNALVAPGEQLCFRCHDLKLDRKVIHGPLASGGCLVCHDPHSSRYRHLLVSESDGFCFHCHSREVVEKNSAHEGLQEQCTTCHDAHMSDNPYLLK